MQGSVSVGTIMATLLYNPAILPAYFWLVLPVFCPSNKRTIKTTDIDFFVAVA